MCGKEWFIVFDGGQIYQIQVEPEGNHFKEEIVHTWAREGVKNRADYWRWWEQEVGGGGGRMAEEAESETIETGGRGGKNGADVGN